MKSFLWFFHIMESQILVNNTLLKYDELISMKWKMKKKFVRKPYCYKLGVLRYNTSQLKCTTSTQVCVHLCNTGHQPSILRNYVHIGQLLTSPHTSHTCGRWEFVPHRAAINIRLFTNCNHNNCNCKSFSCPTLSISYIVYLPYAQSFPNINHTAVVMHGYCRKHEF